MGLEEVECYGDMYDQISSRLLEWIMSMSFICDPVQLPFLPKFLFFSLPPIQSLNIVGEAEAPTAVSRKLGDDSHTHSTLIVILWNSTIVPRLNRRESDASN